MDGPKLEWHPKVSRPRGDGETDARREILDAAAQTFMRHGYAGASIDDVADQLGATKGRIYHYYRSKLDLLLDIHAGILEHMIDGIRPAAEGSGPANERLHEMARLHALLVIHNLAPAQVTLHSILDTFNTRKQMEIIADIARLRDDYEHLFLEVISDGNRDGSLKCAQPELVVKAVLGSLNWIPIWYRTADPQAQAPEKVAESFADFVLNGVGAGRA